MHHLSIRAFKNLYRNQSVGAAVVSFILSVVTLINNNFVSLFQLLQNIILGLLTGVIFLQLKENSQNALIDR